MNYLWLAWRNLSRNPLYTALNVGGLAVGLGVCLLIGLYVQNEQGHDRFHRHADQIYRVTVNEAQSDGRHLLAVTPGPLSEALTRDFQEIEQTLRIGQWPATLRMGATIVEPKRTLIVEPSFFQMFDFQLLLGDANTALGEPDQIVLSETTAEQLFGTDWLSKPVLGTVVTLNGEMPTTIVGVAKNAPHNSQIQFEALLAFKSMIKYDEWSYKWNGNNYHTYLQLRPDADVAGFAQKIEKQMSIYNNQTETRLLLQPLKDIYLHSKFDFSTDWGKRGNYLYVHVFGWVGLIVLLIAVANFVNLATGRASKRAKEVGVRKTTGASRGNLILQFLSESVLTTVLAVVGGLLLAESALPYLEIMAGKTLTIPYYEPQFWAILSGSALVIGLISGLYPAFLLSDFAPSKVLKYGTGKGSGERFRQGLVVGQFAVSVVLGIATMVIFQQLRYIEHKNLGFDQSQLLYVKLKGQARGKAHVFKSELQKLPGVASVAAATNNLVDVSNSSEIKWEGQQPSDEFLITQMNTDPDYLSTLDMKVIAGRSFSHEMAADSAEARFLVNETAAKRMGYEPEKALGKRIEFWGQKGEIIGVLADFHFRPLSRIVEPYVIRYRPQEFYFQMLVKLEPDCIPETLGNIQTLYKKIDPDNPIAYGFVQTALDEQYKTERRAGNTLLCFSILAIFVACLGLFGLATFMAEQRVKEIGIRKVLGASVAAITGLLAKNFLKLVLIAITLAIPIAYFMMQYWLTDFVYRIEVEWWMMGAAGLVAMAIAGLTVSAQSIKAAVANPVESLRNE